LDVHPEEGALTGLNRVMSGQWVQADIAIQRDVLFRYRVKVHFHLNIANLFVGSFSPMGGGENERHWTCG